MAYAILRVEKLKTAGNAGGLNKHLTRTMDVPNADPELRAYNSRPVGSEDLNKDISDRLASAGVKLRGDSVRAVEFLLTASPEHFAYQKSHTPEGKPKLLGNVANWKAFEENSIKWLCDRYGAENVVNVTVHKDEQTPHIHAVVVPIYRKEGESENRLSAKQALGGQQKMREMQSSFAQVHAGQGLKRGLEGSKMSHTDIQDYYREVKAFKATEKEQERRVTLPVPKTQLEAPETDFLGRMKERPDEYVKVQQERLESEIKAFQKQVSDNLGGEITKMLKPVALAEGLKLENRQIVGQVKGLELRVKQLQEQAAKSKFLLEAVMGGKVEPAELKKATEQLPQPGNKREEQLYDLLKKSGIEVKQEKKPVKKQDRGMKL